MNIAEKCHSTYITVSICAWDFSYELNYHLTCTFACTTFDTLYGRAWDFYGLSSSLVEDLVLHETLLVSRKISAQKLYRLTWTDREFCGFQSKSSKGW